MEKLKPLTVMKFSRGDSVKPLQVVITDKVLGKGSFGEVRVGYNKENKNQVFAVKIIDKTKLKTRKAKQDMMSEIELLTVLKSPNIVKMIAETKENEDQYIAMEMCNGRDLTKFLEAKGGFLNEEDARFVLIQIIKGVAAMHERDIMHRDLKTDNIMVHFPNLSYKELFDKRFDLMKFVSSQDVASGYQVKLADLGLARKIEVNSMTDTYCGTPMYMAPEVARGDFYDNTADIWSIGCIFYYLLVGFLPFTANNHF